MARLCLKLYSFIRAFNLPLDTHLSRGYADIVAPVHGRHERSAHPRSRIAGRGTGGRDTLSLSRSDFSQLVMYLHMLAKIAKNSQKTWEIKNITKRSKGSTGRPGITGCLIWIRSPPAARGGRLSFVTAGLGRRPVQRRRGGQRRMRKSELLVPGGEASGEASWNPRSPT